MPILIVNTTNHQEIAFSHPARPGGAATVPPEHTVPSAQLNPPNGSGLAGQFHPPMAFAAWL